MVLNDMEITKLCTHGQRQMINPFEGYQVRRKNAGGAKLLSYGLSSYGYDVKLARDVKVFHNMLGGIVDPKRFDEKKLLLDLELLKDEDGSEYVILPPNGYLLGRTEEYFHIPRNIQVIVVGKSTYARSGLLINCTPIEAGFEGRVVIEAANGTPSPIRVYVNEGIAQFIFFEGNPCETSYADRDGKYQGQTGIQLPKV